MYKNLSAKYYQGNRDYQKNLVKGIKIFLKKKKVRSDNMVMIVTKISQKTKTINQFSTEKNTLFSTL